MSQHDDLRLFRLQALILEALALSDEIGLFDEGIALDAARIAIKDRLKRREGPGIAAEMRR